MKAFLLVVAACVGQVDEVDLAEVARQGDMVQKIDETWQSDVQQAIVEAMGPPLSDEDRWHVYVITDRSCVPCANLKTDWSDRSGALSSIAVYGDPASSWAHLNFYDYRDASQAFRWENIKVLGFPTIIAQPPRSGKYGDPATVVYQSTGYDRNQERLRDSILAAMKRYVAKLNGARSDAEGVNLPFDPPPAKPGTPTKPGVQTPSQQVPPLEVLADPGRWPGYVWGLLGAGVMAGLFGLYPVLRDKYRERAERKALMDKLILDMIASKKDK